MRKMSANTLSGSKLIAVLAGIFLFVFLQSLFPHLGIASGQPPTADASYSERIVYLNRSIELDGSESTDPENDSLTYKWEILEKPAASNGDLLEGDGSVVSFTPDVVGQYTVRLVVNDGTQDSAPYDIKIMARRAPWAEMNGYLRRKLELRAGSPSDPGNSELKYKWSITKKPKTSKVNIEDDSSVIAYLQPDLAGVYEVRLDITDTPEEESYSFFTKITVRHYPCLDKNDPPYPYGVDKPWAAVLCEIGKGLPNEIVDFAKEQVQENTSNFFGTFMKATQKTNESALKQIIDYFGEYTSKYNYQKVVRTKDQGWGKVWPAMKKIAGAEGFVDKLKSKCKSVMLGTVLNLFDFQTQAEQCVKNIMYLILDKMIDKLIDDMRPQPPTIVKLELGDKEEGGKYVRIYFKRSPGDSGPGKSGNQHYYYKLWRWSTGNKIGPIVVGKENGPYGPLATGPKNDQEPLVFYDPNPPEGNNTYRIQAIRIIGKSQIDEQTWDEGKFWVEQLIGVVCPLVSEQISLIKTYTDRALKILKAVKFQKSRLSLPENIYVPKPFERPPLPVSIATNYKTGEVFVSLPFTNSIYRLQGNYLQPFANCQFKDPHQVGLAIDSRGNVYADNSASDDMFGGRIFRWDINGNRKLFGTVNYFSWMLGYAKPCAVQSMVAGWSGHEKLFITDLYAGALKELMIPASGLPSNPNHYVAQTLCKSPQIEINNKTSMCLDSSGSLFLTSGKKIFMVTRNHEVKQLFDDTVPFSELTGIDIDNNNTVYFADYYDGVIYAFPSAELMSPQFSSKSSDQEYLSLHTLITDLDRPGELRLTADQKGLVWFDGSGFHHHIFGLSGRVVDSETGQPLVGAIVSCEDRGTVQMTKTDAFGVFHLPSLSLPDFPQELSLLIRYRNQTGTYRAILKDKGETFIDSLPFVADEVPSEVSGELPQIIQPNPPQPLTVMVNPGEVSFYDNMKITIPGFQPPPGHELPPQPPMKTAPPVVKIVNPVDGMETVFDQVTVIGVVNDPRVTTVQLYVNGSAQDVSVNERKFSVTVPIDEGLNHLYAQASITDNGETLTGRSEPVNVLRVSVDKIPETGAISGILVDRTTGYPASGVRVELVGTDKFAISDSLGTWQIADVPVGIVTIQILP